jgi:hypothetical protein
VALRLHVARVDGDALDREDATMSGRSARWLVPVLGLALAACTVEQTEEGRAPSIDPGEAPAYEVEPADIDLGWDTSVVRVPDVEISPRQDTVVRSDTLPR